MLERAGLDAPLVPHMVDTAVFKPRDRETARVALGLPPDAFVVGVVGLNRKPGSKQLDVALRTFAELRRTRD